MEELNIIGNKIKQRRKELHLTQEELGELVHKSSQVISNWERGYTPTINYDDLAKLSTALKVSVDYFLKNSGATEWTLGPGKMDLSKIEDMPPLDISDISDEEAALVSFMRRSYTHLSKEQLDKKIRLAKKAIKLIRMMEEEDK